MKPKIFIKNAKGRYEPYAVPEADISDKASNLTDIPLSGLGTMEQYCARVLHDLNEITDNIHKMASRDLVELIVRLVFHYDKELKMKYAGKVEIPLGKPLPLWLIRKMENGK